MRPLATLSTTALRHLPRPIWRRALVLFSAGLLACGGTGANQPVVIVRVEVAGCALPVEPGDHCAVTAIPYSAAGRASGGVTWESADPAIATVSVSGAVTGIAEGAVMVSATVGGVVGTREVVVRWTVSTVEVTGCPDPLHPDGPPCALTATARSKIDQAIEGRTVTWQSDAPAIATVDAVGMVTGVATGVATIRATVEGVIGARAVIVNLAVASVSIGGCAANLPPGNTCTLTATASSSEGEKLTGRTVSWSSNQPAIATVDQFGVVTGVGEGEATITATVDGVAGSKTLTIRIPVGGMTASGCELTIQPGFSCQMTAMALSGDGTPLPGRLVVWTSDSNAVATVGQDGVVNGVSHGIATIRAESEGIGTMRQVTVGGFASISSGGFHLCGIRSDASTYCWGWNSRGQLGDGTETMRTLPTRVKGSRTFFSSTTGSEFHSCGISSHGWPYCWGSNDHGELGLGNYESSNTTRYVTGGLELTSIATGQFHSCGVDRSGMAHCWGQNEHGQLGLGGPGPPMTTPTAVVGGEPFRAIAAGAWHTCALAVDGTAWCWGGGGDGQLGHGGSAPDSVAGAHLFTALVAGATHSCGLTASGDVWCWGSAGSFNWGLGDGTTLPSPAPVQVVGGHSFTTISAYGNHTCGIDSVGLAYCWGRNDFGQLGDGSQTHSTIPVAVTDGHRFIAVTTGAYSSCGLKATGATWCWGAGGRGQLGDGTIRDWSLVPTQVIAP